MENERFHRNLLGAIEDLTEALNREVPPPEVTVTVPPAPVPDTPKVDVTVEPPEVNVTVEDRGPCSYVVEITERDSQNFIKRLTIKPV